MRERSLRVGGFFLRCLLILTARRSRCLCERRGGLLHSLIGPRRKLALLAGCHLSRFTGGLFQSGGGLLCWIALHHLLELLLQIGLLLSELRQALAGLTLCGLALARFTLTGLTLSWLALGWLALGWLALGWLALSSVGLSRLCLLRLTFLRLTFFWLTLFRLTFFRLTLLRLAFHRFGNSLLRLLHRLERFVVVVLR